MTQKTVLGPLTLALVVGVVACAKLTEPPSKEIEPAASTQPSNAQLPGSASANPKTVAEVLSAKKEELEKAMPPPTNEKLEIKDVVAGKGAEAKAGDNVKVHYVGTLPDGKEFDASKKHGKPFEFELGAGRVIKGWDQGVAGMKVGGKRKLVVPPSLGYGPRGFPPVIPPNSTLNFEVELLEVMKKK